MTTPSTNETSITKMIEASEALRECLRPVAQAISGLIVAMPWLSDVPITPPPKIRAGMTARQYRAARRQFRRDCDVFRKAVQ